MTTSIFKNEAARQRMEEWYHRFLERADISTTSTTVATSHGENHLLTAGDPSNLPLICLHSMMTGSAHLQKILLAC